MKHNRYRPNRAHLLALLAGLAIDLAPEATLTQANAATVSDIEMPSLVVDGGRSAADREQASRPPQAPAAEAGYVQIVDQDLKDVIAHATYRMGLKARIAPGVRQRLHNVRLPLERAEFLAALEKRFNLAWYIDGDVLDVAPASEVTSRIFPLGGTKFSTLRQRLETAGLHLEGGALRYLADTNSVLVSGTVPVVAKTWALLDAGAAPAPATGPETIGPVVIRGGVVGR